MTAVHSSSYLSASRALFAIFFILLIVLPTRGNDVPAGTWRLTQYHISGESMKPPFAFLRIHEDGRSEVCNGVEKLPCRLYLEDGSFEFKDPSGLGWPTDHYSRDRNIKGFYQHAHPSLILVDPSLDQKGFSTTDFPLTEESLAMANEVYQFEKAGDAAELDLILDRGDSTINEYINLLIQLNASFSVNNEGEITEISYVNCSAEVININLLEKLPSLRRISLAENSQPVPKSDRIDVGVIDLSGDRDWKAKNEVAGGKLLHKGRRARAALPLDPEPAISPPVFSTRSKGNSQSVAASLASFRGKTYAFHHKTPIPGELPHELVHRSLGSPVPLGRPILSRLGFFIREIAGNPGLEWLFEPLPEDAAIFEDGQVWQVRLQDGTSLEGVTRVGVANGIPPGGRIEWGTVELLLTSDPNVELSQLMGCPILDARSGYLVGFVQNVLMDDDVTIEINTFSDLTSLPEPPSRYEGVSFFEIPGRLSPEEVSTSLVGVFRSDFAEFPLGQNLKKDYLLARPYFHYNNLMELPGREYLFSKIEFKNPALINEMKAISTRLRNDDLRLRKFSEFLISHLGRPTESGGTFPEGDSKYGHRIALRWEGEKFTVYFEISQQNFGNRIIATFEVGKTNAVRPPSLTSIKKNQTGGLQSSELLEQYFEWLDTLEPEIDFNGFEKFKKQFLTTP